MVWQLKQRPSGGYFRKVQVPKSNMPYVLIFIMIEPVLKIRQP